MPITKNPKIMTRATPWTQPLPTRCCDGDAVGRDAEHDCPGSIAMSWPLTTSECGLRARCERGCRACDETLGGRVLCPASGFERSRESDSRGRAAGARAQRPHIQGLPSIAEALRAWSTRSRRQNAIEL